MGFIIIASLGALIGWAGSILLSRESGDDVLALVVCAALGAVTLGAMAVGADLLVEVEPAQLGWAILGGVVGMAIGLAARTTRDENTGDAPSDMPRRRF